jgi:hypothetical protein
MTQLLLKLLGKRDVKRILNLWIKDQINVCLEHNVRIQFDHTIWLDQYILTSKKFNEIPDFLQDEPLEVSDFFEYIGNKI